MKLKQILSFLVLVAIATTYTQAQGDQTGKALIISTTSQSEIDKIKETLKDADPTTYRLTITTNVRGKSKTTTLGSAPIEEVNKIRGGSKIDVMKGNYAASDIVIIVKNITKSGKLRDDILKQIDSKLTKSAVVDLSYQVDKSNQLKVGKIGN